MSTYNLGFELCLKEFMALLNDAPSLLMTVNKFKYTAVTIKYVCPLKVHDDCERKVTYNARLYVEGFLSSIPFVSSKKRGASCGTSYNVSSF